MKKTALLIPRARRQHFPMLVVERKGKGKEAMAALLRIDRRCHDPAGPPALARPDHRENAVSPSFARSPKGQCVGENRRGVANERVVPERPSQPSGPRVMR